MLALHIYVVAVLLFTCYGYCQKQGDSCVIEHTNAPGFCAPAITCQSARRDYHLNGTKPTFCNRSILNITICCGDDSSLLNTSDNEHRLVSSDNKETAKDNRRKSEKKCEEYSSRVNKTVDVISLLPGSQSISLSISTCNYNGVELIVGGDNAGTGEFPHMAAIGWVNFEDTYSFLCGGSLINTKYVLTAAHCSKCSKMKNPNPVIVRLGDQNLDPTKNDGASPIEVPIKNIRKHPQYKSPSIYNDIALLELASDIEITDDIRPACLWNKPVFPGHTRALATGWEFVDPPTLHTSNELKKVSLSLLGNDIDCNNLLPTQRNSNWYNLHIDKQLCAAELRGGKNMCQSPGSPLQLSHQNKCVFHLIGVRSFGNNCVQPGSPIVYTNITAYLDWIESIVWPEES